MQKITFKISGMSCGSCAKVIKLDFEEEKGVKTVDVDFNSAKASLEFDETKISIASLKKVIEKSGYKASQE